MKVLKTIGKVVLVLLALGIIMGFGVQLVGDRQLAGRLAALKAAGMPVSIADLQGEPVPESQNAAPVYEQAFKMMREPDIKKDGILLCEIFRADHELSEQDWKTAEAAVERSDRLYKLLESAQSRPLCRFTVSLDDSKMTGFEQTQLQMERQFKHLAELRDMTRLFGMKALVCAHSGDTSGVVANIESALKATSAIAEKPSLIQYMVGEAMTKLSLSNLRKSLKYCSFNAAQICQLDSVLSKINAEKLYRNALIGERAYYLTNNEKLISGGMGHLPQSGMDTAAYLDFMKMQIDNTHLTYPQALTKVLLGDRASAQIPSYAILARMIAPVIARAGILHYKSEAEIACARVALALEYYKSKNGDYPNNLAELKIKLPLDPFTGNELIYKPLANGYIVYSVGPNQKDDGGVDQASSATPTNADDVAWKIER